ncbi:MAG: hypothetical protein CO148_00830 [Nitrospirae bacterium CG_4_9_14_3_um_filter_41_27]|nr:MAG: hypothetical protein AUJ63_01855 [Candidatus Pacearchaeota archaeon CG1_02_35_32]PIQ94104.1 MAG: hypothetical protein COV68_06380 [Nitrospirae bacterium CG11_big_fil_rev_8_21_14_0_20_41_14]PIV42453.1 MAG: hypothetical protein COS27_07070 [Nitrospirae bacterium CG02_land_8_20_14_3_00_41_53]PIW87069.1 MAG: hypothetical protein COZ94_07100 [Nitrospirae bacterium CG_4_8_14_3_um_filter_41_47]PJA81001.1 MAG: hypothetical protein CO148_00830 [Nitrospirae bacterium CG_4_9_14_3_um_filter_41_27]
MKKINIIPLAQKKSGKRGIPQNWIEETVYSPGQIVSGYGGRKVAQRRYIVEGKEYLLRVIYEEREDMYEVVTAYLTSQIERYWKGGEDENRI